MWAQVDRIVSFQSIGGSLLNIVAREKEMICDQLQWEILEANDLSYSQIFWNYDKVGSLKLSSLNKLAFLYNFDNLSLHVCAAGKEVNDNLSWTALTLTWYVPITSVRNWINLG